MVFRKWPRNIVASSGILGPWIGENRPRRPTGRSHVQGLSGGLFPIPCAAGSIDGGNPAAMGHGERNIVGQGATTLRQQAGVAYSSGSGIDARSPWTSVEMLGKTRPVAIHGLCGESYSATEFFRTRMPRACGGGPKDR